jgi:hypothetical protein
MNNFLRTIIAGWGAKKLGGGCLGTILVFIIIYYALGTCNSHPVQTVPKNHTHIQAHPTNSQVYVRHKPDRNKFNTVYKVQWDFSGCNF